MNKAEKEAFDALFGDFVEEKINEILARDNTPPGMKEPEQFLSVGQAAKEFGCTTHLLYKAMNNLEIPYYKPENRTYIKRIDVHKYLESIKIRTRDDIHNYEFMK